MTGQNQHREFVTTRNASRCEVAKRAEGKKSGEWTGEGCHWTGRGGGGWYTGTTATTAVSVLAAAVQIAQHKQS